MRYLGLCLLALLASGCSEQPGSYLGSTGRPIFNGTPDTDPAHMASVALVDGSGHLFCSGTLITPTVVLTAGHCLWGGSSGTQVFFGNDLSAAGDYRSVIEDATHPEFSMGFRVEADIAVLRLATPAPAGVTPIPHLPAAQGLTTADEGVTSVDFSGFGLTETGDDGVKLHVSDVIDIVCDDPGGCANDVANRAFGYDQQPGGPCSGDSGGPAFVLRNNVEYVAGITSYGDQDCISFGVSTTVDRFEPFINSFITPEICDNQIDDDTDGYTDCEDRECSLDPSCPDACESAQVIACGGQATGTTAGGAWAFVHYSCVRPETEEIGPEVAFRVDAPAGVVVTADLTTGSGGDLDFFLLPASGGTCDPAACLDSSTNYNRPEQIVFTMPAGGAYLVVDTWDDPTSFDLQIQCEGDPEDCDNGQDDDGDGDTDCADADCVADPACIPDEICDNTVDDDLDGDTDCDDADCVADPACVPDEVCDNSTDDDLDGDTDCDDADCVDFPACIPDEVCDNSTDDDRDGDTDCDDADCASYPACIPDEVCDNGVDDDRDGDSDCDDSDCYGDAACVRDEICGNSVDDDFDGDTDCDDGDCEGNEVCEVGKSYGCGCRTRGEGVGGGLILLAAILALLRTRTRARARNY